MEASVPEFRKPKAYTESYSAKSLLQREREYSYKAIFERRKDIKQRAFEEEAASNEAGREPEKSFRLVPVRTLEKHHQASQCVCKSPPFADIYILGNLSRLVHDVLNSTSDTEDVGLKFREDQCSATSSPPRLQRGLQHIQCVYVR